MSRYNGTPMETLHLSACLISIIIISRIGKDFELYCLTTYYKAVDKWYVLTINPHKGQLWGISLSFNL